MLRSNGYCFGDECESCESYDFSKGLKISMKAIFKFYWHGPTNNVAYLMHSAGKKWNPPSQSHFNVQTWISLASMTRVYSSKEC